MEKGAKASEGFGKKKRKVSHVFTLNKQHICHKKFRYSLFKGLKISAINVKTGNCRHSWISLVNHADLTLNESLVSQLSCIRTKSSTFGKTFFRGFQHHFSTICPSWSFFPHLVVKLIDVPLSGSNGQDQSGVAEHFRYFWSLFFFEGNE